jgi:hypothetical protein
MSTNDLSKSVIFPIGEKFESENFKGTVWLNMLTPFGSALPIANVTFWPLRSIRKKVRQPGWNRYQTRITP